MSGSRRAGDNPVKLTVQGALAFKQFVIVLQAQKEAFGHAEIARKAQIEIGIDRCVAVDYLAQARGFDTER